MKEKSVLIQMINLMLAELDEDDLKLVIEKAAAILEEGADK